VAGSSLAVLETVLERWDGSDEDCFAQNEIYQVMLKQCVPNEESKPQIKWFVTPIELVMAGLSMSPQTQLYAGIASAYLPTLGLNKLKAYGGTTEIATKEFESISRTVVVTNPPPAGLLKVFEFPDTLTGPADWVPADAASFTAFNWNIDGAYKALGAMYDTFQGRPGSWDQLIDGLSDQADGIHIKEDIVDVLTGEVQFYMNIKPGADLNADMPTNPLQGIVAISVRDAAKARTLIDHILKEADEETATRMFQGTEILEVQGDNPVAIAIVNDRIYFAENSTRLESAILGMTGEPLSRSPRYLAAKAHMPEKFSMTSWTDPALQWETFYTKLKAGEFDNMLEGNLNTSTLPEFTVISKYLRPTVSYMVPTERGTMTVNFTLRPTR
jgi:hypothetical protein